MQIGSPFLLGVNYWPRKKAMWMWEQFGPAEIREEFALIRSIGMTHVRFFLLWESFQPQPGKISSKALNDLRTLADIAAELGLKLEPTFFCGHMSGPNWAPDWMLSKTPRAPTDRWFVSLNRHHSSDTTIYNTFTEPFILEAEKLQLREVCRSLKDHPAIWAWSLGNEPDLFCVPPNDTVGHEWIRTMVGTIKEADPNHLATIGFHTRSIDANCGLRVDHAADCTDFSVMHGYSIYHPHSRRPLDPDFVPFAAGLTAALAGRPILFEEFGLCTWDKPVSDYQEVKLSYSKMARQFFSSQADGATYYAEVLPRLHRMGCLGTFAWCFPDYAPVLWDRPPCDHVIHERTFGLFRPDGTPKPAALAIKAFADTKPMVQKSERPVILPCLPDDYYKNPWNLMKELYEKFGTL